MIAVLTGDIINSRQGQTSLWLNQLKSTLNLYGQTPKDWEIFRGDSFQLKTNPENALRIALHIKAVIKQVKPYDVRIAIGLGEQSYDSKTISESNGTAFVNSGEGFESLKKQTLTVVSENKKWDNTINIMINLALLTANNWSNTVAKVISTVIENPEKNQNDIALLLGKSQSTISEALKRGGYEEIMQLNTFYKEQILNL
ncbi:SatD family protein [Mesoflavibacter zeaxanthinifaciens]|uniref:SatD family protein n=1 Tax=Mesoflavibacter zeaxanthinifaciens TaxID=393060 RepID=UPI0003F637D0|nr:SatD family protein [Mesoflavibacter zeaxanthinifaciens]